MELIKDTVKELIDSLQAKRKPGSRLDPDRLIKKLLTKREFAHIKVSNFRKGILYIHVDSSSRLYFLNLRKEDLLERLRRDLADLKDIRFVLGEIG